MLNSPLYPNASCSIDTLLSLRDTTLTTNQATATSIAATTTVNVSLEDVYARLRYTMSMQQNRGTAMLQNIAHTSTVVFDTTEHLQKLLDTQTTSSGEREKRLLEQLSTVESENVVLKKRVQDLERSVHRIQAATDASAAVATTVESAVKQADALITKNLRERNSKIHELESKLALFHNREAATAPQSQYTVADTLANGETLVRLKSTVSRCHKLEDTVDRLHLELEQLRHLVEAVESTQRMTLYLSSDELQDRLLNAYSGKNADKSEPEANNGSPHHKLCHALATFLQKSPSPSQQNRITTSRELLRKDYQQLSDFCSRQASQIENLRHQLSRQRDLRSQMQRENESLRQKLAGRDNRKLAESDQTSEIRDTDKGRKHPLSSNAREGEANEEVMEIAHEEMHADTPTNDVSAHSTTTARSGEVDIGSQARDLAPDVTKSSLPTRPNAQNRPAHTAQQFSAPSLCIVCDEPHYGLLVKCTMCGLSFHSHCVNCDMANASFVCSSCCTL